MNINDIHVSIRLIRTEKSWMEGLAIDQLRTAASRPGIELAVGLPDLHPGKGLPVGAAMLSRGVIYPAFIGNDVGCGMAFQQCELKVRKLKRDRLARRLTEMAATKGKLAPEAPEQWAVAHGYEFGGMTEGLGSIGGGNHFAELLELEKVLDPETWDSLNLDPQMLFLLVHCGSRGHGEKLYRDQSAVSGADALRDDSEAAQNYLARHQILLRWAETNRAVIGAGMLEMLGADGRLILDNCHNSITPIAADDGTILRLHRKGAAAADRGPVLIAGSRGAFSYLVVPVGDQSGNAFSLAHGAGRKWNRQSARGRLETRYSADALRQTPLHSLVICPDKALLYEEAPEVYKNIDQVIADLESHHLIRVAAKFRPLLTFKP